MYHRPLLFALLLLAGCLEFDAQQITILYDAKADRIDVQIVYRGLFAEPSPRFAEPPIERAVRDLESVRRSGRISLMSNWPLAVDFGDARLRSLPIMASVDVENGPLFTDAAGSLCGCQFVRIRGAKAFLAAANAALEAGLQASMAKADGAGGGERTLDAVTREALVDFVRTGQRLLHVEPGRIEWRIPCSDDDHAWIKGTVLGGLADSLADDLLHGPRATTEDRRELSARIFASATFQFLLDNEISLVREPGLTRVALGTKGRDRLDIVKPSGGRYDDALLRHLRGKGEAIEDGLTDDQLERRFAEFRTRDAMLPPDLAAIRSSPAEAK